MADMAFYVCTISYIVAKDSSEKKNRLRVLRPLCAFLTLAWALSSSELWNLVRFFHFFVVVVSKQMRLQAGIQGSIWSSKAGMRAVLTLFAH